MFTRLIGALAIALALSGCSTFTGFIETIVGDYSQRATRDPLYVYKPDLRFTVDGSTFDGYGVTLMGPKTIAVQSQVKIDRVEVSTCARHHVCQVKGGELACVETHLGKPIFDVDTSWFGTPGKTMTYKFFPSEVELSYPTCGQITIAVYDKKVLAAWGFLYLRRPEGFPAKFTCNAKDWKFAGVSVCSARQKTVQSIKFDSPVDSHGAEHKCGMEKKSDTHFEFRPSDIWCRASFLKDGKDHDVIINGYDEVLNRGN